MCIKKNIYKREGRWEKEDGGGSEGGKGGGKEEERRRERGREEGRGDREWLRWKFGKNYKSGYCMETNDWIFNHIEESGIKLLYLTFYPF